ncbi:Uncharacterised protein [Vibrio cholerae]|nr:Uncharacterised protein [Vibrio cholerae]
MSFNMVLIMEATFSCCLLFSRFDVSPKACNSSLSLEASLVDVSVSWLSV